jgi:mono/diheme cytochrome c family protein
MKRAIIRILKVLGVVVVIALLGGGAFAGYQVHAFNKSMGRTYDVPLPTITRSTDPAVLERGKHLAESIGACASKDCHGATFGGGEPIKMGPLGTMQGPNITAGGRGAEYSDAELARLISHGLKRDGHGLTFMPAQDFAWWPDDDVVALISYLRTVPSVATPSGGIQLGLLAKGLDRLNMIPIDVARRIDHEHRPVAPAPTPTVAYGTFLVNACRGCHGATLSGGRIPGAPSEMAIPLNITPHETGIAGWTYEDFDKLLSTGIRKNGKTLDPMMPVTELGKFNPIERKALWAYLMSAPAKPFGGR